MEASSLIIAISVAVASVAFVVLVIFLALTLASLVKSLKRTDALIMQSNEIAENLNEKLHSLDPLFGCIKNVGCFAEEKSKVIEHKAEKIREEIEEEEEYYREGPASLLEFVEWGLLGVSLALSLRKKK